MQRNSEKIKTPLDSLFFFFWSKQLRLRAFAHFAVWLKNNIIINEKNKNNRGNLLFCPRNSKPAKGCDRTKLKEQCFNNITRKRERGSPSERERLKRYQIPNKKVKVSVFLFFFYH